MEPLLEKAVVALLRAEQPVQDIIAGRLYVDHLPQNPVYPALTYRLVSDLEEITHDGARSFANRIQVTSWASAYGQCRRLHQAVKDLLSGYRGQAAGIEIQGSFFLSAEPLYDPDEPDKSAPAHYVPADFMIHFSAL